MSEHEKTAAGEGAQAVLENILRLMGLEAKVQASDLPDGGRLFQIESADSSRIIGREGQGLEALQLLVNRMVSRGDPNAVRYMIDSERYRQRQQDELRTMALDAAGLAVEGGHEVKLPPMGSAERRIIHQALKDNPKVRTESEETEEGKRVVVFPVDAEASGNR